MSHKINGGKSMRNKIGEGVDIFSWLPVQIRISPKNNLKNFLVKATRF